MYNFLNNGVKARNDNMGDGWASAHRLLGKTFNMQDVDALFGAVAFGQNTGEKLFLEYVPDDYLNRGSAIRTFKIVAMFDRKTSIQAADHFQNSVSMAFYLWICRSLSTHQKRNPKFFYVIGGGCPPWGLIGIDLFTGERSGEYAQIETADEIGFNDVWKSFGLIELRQSITKEFYNL